MDIRLLAHGGTSYRERRRIGAWPAVPAGTLEDLYGLRSERSRTRAEQHGLGPGGFSFGCAVMDSNAVLVLRQHQNLSSRGGYAFTLLLDPGLAIWERFEWNPAAIINQILNDADVRPALFETPESFDPELLASRLHPHGIAQQQPTAKCVDALATILMGGVLSSAPLASDPALLEETALLSHLESLLASLPVFLRVGAGWIVGAGATQGRLLGAHVVFDDESSDVTDTKAAEVWQAWKGLSNDAECCAALKTLNDTPLHLWHDDPAIVVDDVLALSRLLAPGAISDEEFGAFAAGARAGIGVLSEPITEALVRAASSGDGPLSENRTAFVIDRCFNGMDPAPRLVSRLDEPTLFRELRRRGVPPGNSPLALIPSQFLRAWTELLQSSPNALDLVDTACKQIANETTALVLAALDGYVARKDDLAAWHTLKLPPHLKRDIRSLIRTEVLDRIAQLRGLDERRTTMRSIEYVLFADDSGGEDLCSLYPESSIEISTIVNSLIDSVSSRSCEEWAAEIRRWLNDAAASSIRERLEPILKKNVAETLGAKDSQWKYFYWLEKLLEGERDPGSLQASTAETRVLLNEFRQLLNASSITGKTPNLRGLAKLFSKNIPPDLIDSLKALHPLPSNSDQLERWLAGWDDLEPGVRFDEEVRLTCEWMRKESSLQPALEAGTRPPLRLTDLRAAHWQQVFEAIRRERQMRTDLVVFWLDKLADTVQAGARDARTAMETIVQRYPGDLARSIVQIGSETECFNELSRHLSDQLQDQLLSALAKAKIDAGQNLRQCWRNLLPSLPVKGRNLPLYDKAVMRFLLRTENRYLLKEMARANGKPETEIAQHFQRLLETPNFNGVKGARSAGKR